MLGTFYWKWHHLSNSHFLRSFAVEHACTRWVFKSVYNEDLKWLSAFVSSQVYVDIRNGVSLRLFKLRHQFVFPHVSVSITRYFFHASCDFSLLNNNLL